MKVRTRFAPSPTGFLHLGGARTALYAWLYAKKKQGQFILRIEDTDRERSTEEAIKAIFEGLRWLGLEWDEGPYYQTKRFHRYEEVIQQLLASGKAYRCNCSKERLEALRAQHMANKEKPRYDGHCRDLNLQAGNGEQVIRFKNPLSGKIIVDDQVYGQVIFDNAELDDLIIQRSDGTPTYNFCVVVDDWDMEITHVIRGDDHLNNTPRQINILKALDAPVPIYAHVPMILGADGKKLSKRQGAVGVMHYRDLGFLPQAMVNYLIRLGWSAGDQEIFSREEMIQLFDIADLNKSAAAFNLEKLSWLNQHYIKTLPPEEVAKHLSWHMRHLKLDLRKGPPLTAVIPAFSERSKDLHDMAEKARFLYEDNVVYQDTAEAILDSEALIPLNTAYEILSAIPAHHWRKEELHSKIQSIINKSGVKMGKIAQPIRVAVTGTTFSPPIDITLELLGREKALARMKTAIEYSKGKVAKSG